MEDIQHPSPRDGQQVPAPAANDEPLLDAVRNGDQQAFGELYARHRGAVFAVARLHSNSHAEAEDITSEAFTRVLALLKSGGGPRQFLRAYLVTAVSRLAADRAHDLNRTQPQEPHEQGKLDQIQLFDDTVVRQVDAAVVARAFASLPERWQEVLWYLEIEGYRPRQVASVVGMQPNAVSALGKRARDGLRTAYMQQHVSARALEECGEYSTQLGAFVRGTLTPSKLKLMQDHLDSCERCTAEYLQLQDLGVGLRGWILPILAGLPLWGDASERLLAALGTAGAGGATAVSGVVSSSMTTPPGAGAEGTSGSSAGGVLVGSATKIIIAAAAVAVVGAGTIGIVSAFQQDSSDVANTNQAQPVVGEAGEAGDSAGQGSAAGDSADSPGDSSERDAERSNDDRDSRSDTQSRSDSSGQDGGGAAAGGSGGASGDVLGGAGALLPPAANSGSSSDSSGENPTDISAPASPGAPNSPQLETPVTPSLPGLVLPGDPLTSEATGPRDGSGTGSVVEDEVDGAPEVPGTGESPEPAVTPDIDNPATGDSGTDDPGADEPGAGGPGVDEPDGDGPVAGDPDTGESGTDGPAAPGAEEPGVGEPGTDNPDAPSGNNGNTDPGGTGNTDPEGTGSTNPGGTGNTNPGGTGTTPGGTGTTTPGGTENTNPGTPPSNPGEGTPVTPGTPSSPEDPPTSDPGAQPTVPSVNPTGPPPTTAPVQPTPSPVPPAQPTPTPVPPAEPTTPPAQPTPPVVPPDEPIGDRGEDLTDPSEPITGWWGTVPRGWTLIDWIVFLLTGVRP